MKSFNSLMVETMVAMHARSSSHQASMTECNVCQLLAVLKAAVLDQAQVDQMSDAEAERIADLMETESEFALQHAILTLESEAMVVPRIGKESPLQYQIVTGHMPKHLGRAIRYLHHRKAITLQEAPDVTTLVLLRL